jgi:phage tail-like protein
MAADDAFAPSTTARRLPKFHYDIKWDISTLAWRASSRPLPKFYFEMKWDGIVMYFHEVSGLAMEPQAIEYRHGDSQQFSTIKMPGLKKFSNVTMKKGVFNGDNKSPDWFNKIKKNTIKRKTMTISLLDEAGTPTMVWTLTNAWPSKITGTNFKAQGNEVAVDTIEISHEGLTIAND